MNKNHSKNMANKRKGFTLIELLIVLALIGMIFSLGYSILHFSRKAHTDTVNKMERQEALKMATKVISQELSTAFYLEVEETQFNHEKEGDKFIESNGNDIKLFKKVKTNWTEDIILNFKNEFVVKKSGDNDSVAIVTITILDDDGNELESLSSRMFISNMLEGRQKVLSPVDGGSYVLYNNTTKESALPTPGISTGCFIATATYGSVTHPYIILLTEFRDEHLANSALGRSFINQYYKYSPRYAAIIEKSDFLKLLSRVLLAPIVAIVFTMIRIPYYNFILISVIFILLKIKTKHKKVKIS